MNNPKSYSEKLKTGKYWENVAKEWLESKGYSVEIHTTYDDDGNEIFQLYAFVDGNNYPHPDFVVSKSNDEKYIEIKFYSNFYENTRGKVSEEILNPNKRYLSIHTYQFDSYLQLSRWKEMETHVFFLVESPFGSNWYFQDVEILDKTKIEVENAFFPKEEGLYYFWSIGDLKKIKR
jgi:hypothetical protein